MSESSSIGYTGGPFSREENAVVPTPLHIIRTDRSHHEILQTLPETPGFRLIDVDHTALNTPEGSWGTLHSLGTAMRYGVFCGARTAPMWIF